MSHPRWPTAAALLTVLTAPAVVPAAPVPAEKSALAAVPASAPLALHRRAVEGTKERIVTLLRNALPERAPLATPALDAWVKDGIDGRKLRGVPKDGPVFVVFPEMPRPGDNPPKIAVLTAV